MILKTLREKKIHNYFQNKDFIIKKYHNLKHNYKNLNKSLAKINNNLIKISKIKSQQLKTHI